MEVILDELKLVLGGSEMTWAQNVVTWFHYLHAPVDVRSSPMAYIVELQNEPVGCLIFGRPQSTRCYTGKLTYGSYQEKLAGRVQFDRWEVLNLARVWLHPSIQKGGNDYVHHAASRVIKMALARVGYDYLLAHPPVDCNYPYQIRCVLSYCDTRLHNGWIYLASRFRLARTNDDGIQTYMRQIAGLDETQDALIRKFAAQSLRSKQMRMQRRTEALQLGFESSYHPTGGENGAVRGVEGVNVDKSQWGRGL